MVRAITQDPEHSDLLDLPSVAAVAERIFAARIPGSDEEENFARALDAIQNAAFARNRVPWCKAGTMNVM